MFTDVIPSATIFVSSTIDWLNVACCVIATMQFWRRFADGARWHLGTAIHYHDGWVFVPNVSRERHATMEECLPRWLGYPDDCDVIGHEPLLIEED